MVRTASAPRRLLAFGLDYLVIAAYIGVLTAAGFAVRAALGLEVSPPGTWRARLAAHAGAFLVLTLPVILYFALTEASLRGATLGKRALGLRVVDARGRRVSTGRALLREAVRFAPWEIAHTVTWQMPGAFTAEASPSTAHIAGYGVSLALAGWYVISMFVGKKRTPYDRVAGTQVVLDQGQIAR